MKDKLKLIEPSDYNINNIIKKNFIERWKLITEVRYFQLQTLDPALRLGYINKKEHSKLLDMGFASRDDFELSKIIYNQIKLNNK